MSMGVSNSCAPSMKNGRFSGYRSSRSSEMFTTVGSLSNCAKSGLMVMFVVRLEPMGRITSRPTLDSPFCPYTSFWVR